MIESKKRVISIEKRLEEQIVSLDGMQKVLESKGFSTPKKEMLRIIFELRKLLGEIEKIKTDTIDF